MFIATKELKRVISFMLNDWELVDAIAEVSGDTAVAPEELVEEFEEFLGIAAEQLERV